MQYERIGVLGGGIMGARIAEVSARVGAHVVVHEVDDAASARARARIDASLGSALARRKLDQESASGMRKRIEVSYDLDALADRQLVVEAIVEDEAVKLDVFVGRPDRGGR